MEAKGRTEKRRFLRVPCDLAVEVILDDKVTEHSIVNISKGGLRITPPDQEPEQFAGTRVCLKFDTAGRTVWALGRVVFSKLARPGRCLGIKFTYMMQEQEPAIDKLVQLGTWRAMRINYV